LINQNNVSGKSGIWIFPKDVIALPVQVGSMKRSLAIFALLMFSSMCKAQSDSLVIHFKSGAKQTVALKDIRKITFDSLKADVAKPQPLPDVPRVYPNPSTDGTTVRFTLPEAGSVDVTIFNTKGHLVRRIKYQHLPAGDHEVFWDGRDGHGADIASGSYLCEVRSKGKLQVSKMIVLRK
jgi:hypothetical protein